MVFEHLERAWTAYRRNIWSLVGAYLLVAVIAGLLVGGGVVIAMMPILAASTSGQTPTMEELTSGMPLMIIGVIVALIGMFITVALQGGYIAMTRDALKRKSNISSMFKVVRERWMSLIGTAILSAIIAVIFFLPAIIVGVYAIIITSWELLAVAILLGIIAMFACLLLNFSIYAVALDKAKAVDGVKRSIAMVKRHYLKVLGLAILLFLIALGGALLSMIPFIGTIITIIFIGPFTMLAWTSCYLSLKNKK
jgi:hypothetical protein